MNTKTDLMDELAAPENLLSAWRAVRGNIPQYRRERSAGPDGISLADFEHDLPAQLIALRSMLLKGRYKPQPPGVFTIEKRNGGSRQIALLNVVDRVAQRAAQQVIEPLFEPHFLPCSFGFRPGRSTTDAIYCARRTRKHGYQWVVDGDIATCFDALDHQLLMQRVAKRIADKRVQTLLHLWLSAGLLEQGLPQHNSNMIAQYWSNASQKIKQGFTWAADTLSSRDHDEYNRPMWPLGSASSKNYLEAQLDERIDGDTWNQDADDFQPVFVEEDSRRNLERQVLQNIATGGLLLGSSYARQALAKVGPLAVAALKSPAGREFLRQSILVGGGAVGATTGLAVTAYLIYRRVTPAPVGILQGSPLSPLLANIYLHSFDMAVTRAGHRLIRYADDWVILCPDQEIAEKAYNQAVMSLANIQLKINPDKTKILSPSDRLEWLGEVIL